MSPRKTSRRLSVEKRRELEVCAAIARESVLQTHVTRAIKFIELASNRVSVMRMMGIYTRVHDLSGRDAEVFSNRVLSVLGRARKAEAPVVFVEGEDERPMDSRSLMRAMRDRLRGRRMHELRRSVILHAGATQAALIDVHVKHALRFVAELKDTHSIADALQVYGEMVEVPANMKEALQIYTLDRLAAEELPRSQQARATDAEQVNLFPTQPRGRKRVG